MSAGISRRAVIQVVGTIAATLYGVPTATAKGQRAMSLVLDDVSVIYIRYRGREVAVSPAMVIDALSGKASEELR